jgi:excisionase family DNA binding protein
MTSVDDLLTPEQVASYLQVDRGTVYRYIRDGRLAASKLGRTYRVSWESVRLLLWATRTQDDLPLRDYTHEEITGFVKADQLDDAAREVVRRFESAAGQVGDR